MHLYENAIKTHKNEDAKKKRKRKRSKSKDANKQNTKTHIFADDAKKEKENKDVNS